MITLRAMKNEPKPTIKVSHVRTPRTALLVRTQVKAGPTRRAELDHVGAYNFMVEISGVNAGYFRG